MREEGSKITPRKIYDGGRGMESPGNVGRLSVGFALRDW
jgi:hypothetical protein